MTSKNAPRGSGSPRIKEAGNCEDWTVPQLRERAREIGPKGCSAKKKSDLISALRNS